MFNGGREPRARVPVQPDDARDVTFHARESLQWSETRHEVLRQETGSARGDFVGPDAGISTQERKPNDMNAKTIFATLALMGSGTLAAGCASGGGDSSEVPKARTARGGQGSCSGSAKAEASCSKGKGSAAVTTASNDAANSDNAAKDEAKSPTPAEEEEVEMLCGEKRCA